MKIQSHNDTRIVTFGDVDERSYSQLLTCVDAGRAPYAVLCADHHPGYSQPIGAAIAYLDQISPSGVGYDIGCGNKAVKTNLTVSDIAADLENLVDEMYSRISFGIGRINNEPVDHPVLDLIAHSPFVPQRKLLQLAKDQLGTVGSGNHYVDIFFDSQMNIWIGVHFGSRGFGHKTASGFLSLSQGGKFDERGKEGEMDSAPVLFDVDSSIGQDYIEAMRVAGAYAFAGRDIVVDRVLDILGATAVKTVHNHHNYAWPETHEGQDLWVVRKGCTPAFPDQESFIGANMRDSAYIVSGRNNTQARMALNSTVHGAGRVMSRRQAAGKTKWKDGKRVTVKPGLVDYAEVYRELTEEQYIIIRGGGPDEAPQVYKNLNQVIAEHADTILHEYQLDVLAVMMAGDNEFDPYKD